MISFSFVLRLAIISVSVLVFNFSLSLLLMARHSIKYFVVIYATENFNTSIYAILMGLVLVNEDFTSLWNLPRHRVSGSRNGSIPDAKGCSTALCMYIHRCRGQWL
jgi:hypothetical protein